MHQINEPYPGKRAGAAIAVIAIICGAIGTLPASLAWPAPAGSAAGSRRVDCKCRELPLQLAAEPAAPVTQDEADDEDKDVPTSQVDKYISVYAAMQKDHNLTVEQAASQQGLTVAQFRRLENKIENDDTLRERVRKALRHAANPKASDSSDE
ncbi:MAG: hypothetical protein WCA22_18695 [Candidatus Binatus sp.]